MISQNPNATPIWLLRIFSAIGVYGYPRIKKFVAKYVHDNDKQSFYTFIIWLIVLIIVVTLSMIF